MELLNKFTIDAFFFKEELEEKAINYNKNFKKNL